MRLTRYLLLIVTGGVLILAGPRMGLTQFQGKGKGKGGGFDPSRMFNFMSGGKDFIVINDMIANSSRFDPNVKDNLESFAQRNGITNGQLTRDQFAAYMQERMANGMGGRGGPGGGRGGPSGPGGQRALTPEQDFEERAKARFDRYDRNKDGVLNADEMPDTLRAELSQWDKNHNGLIEYDEFKEYYKARIEFIRDQRGGSSGDPSQWDNGWNGLPGQTPPVEEEKRPPTYRVGHMPKGLPTWFEQLDTDKDGQVGLYEWKAAGYSYSDFQKWDLNSDGFITAEEALRYAKIEQEQLAKAGGSASPGMTAMGPGGRGGPGGRMGGPGGGPGGPPNWRGNNGGNGPPSGDGGRPRGRGGPGGGPDGGGRNRGMDNQWNNGR
jgi:hypothetical protein